MFVFTLVVSWLKLEKSHLVGIVGTVGPFLVWILGNLLASKNIKKFFCPRCNQPFGVCKSLFPWNSLVLGRKCAHCGLRQYTAVSAEHTVDCGCSIGTGVGQEAKKMGDQFIAGTFLKSKDRKNPLLRSFFLRTLFNYLPAWIGLAFGYFYSKPTTCNVFFVPMAFALGVFVADIRIMQLSKRLWPFIIRVSDWKLIETLSEESPNPTVQPRPTRGPG